MATPLEAARAVADGIAAQVDATAAHVVAENQHLAALRQTLVDARRVVELLGTPGPTPTPDPGPAPVIPAGAGAVRIGAATYPLAAVDPTAASNPPGAPYDGFRGQDQLVAYTSGVSPANRYGVESTVRAGRVVETVDRRVTGTGGLTVPAGGLVLSGHGNAAVFLAKNAAPGAAVTFEATTPNPGPTPTPTPTPAPVSGRQVAVYLKMWPGSRLPSLAAAAVPGVTEIRLAFLQGSPPRLVGYGSQDLAGVVRDAKSLRERGVLINGSVGGAGGAVDTRSRETFLGGLGAVHAAIGLDRWDVDIEASSLRGDDIIALARTAHDRWGLTVTMAPNGGNVGQYLPVGVELARAGLLAAWGQQFYDSNVPLSAAQGRIAESIRAGIPARLTQVGMMVGSDARHWTLDTCEANLRAVRERWPDIAGAYLWTETYAEVPEWARRVSAALS